MFHRQQELFQADPNRHIHRYTEHYLGLSLMPFLKNRTNAVHLSRYLLPTY